MEIKENFYHLVTFERPILGKKDHWVCCIGGIEFSGDNLAELRARAIQILEREVGRLRQLG